MRLIDADAFLKALNETPLDFIDVGGDFGFFDETIDSVMNEQPTVDAVEVDAIQAWLYEIAMNNTGNVSRVCEELISRLDGLRVFAKERRTDNA